ncbi:hypothetical protein E2C01_045615 [Portunus trituberculatus]|uniref:Uncharacterized protein n=1 Tax=Portunus trituberculatus TaxID=210409 RepID=A0A5B7FYS1_PORTR|nr:hypothetical protein [Portunus trituberculatus]
MRDTDPPDIEKERLYCFDVSEPHPAPDCSQMHQIERLSVEQLEGTKEHYKPEWAHRNLAEYSNEETANIYGGYYTQDISREPYSMGQTQMAKQDYPIERTHQSTEHIYTEHHTQDQYLFIDEQNYSCSSRPVPFLIKEERGGEERPGVSGEARSDDSSSEELGTAGETLRPTGNKILSLLVISGSFLVLPKWRSSRDPSHLNSHQLKMIIAREGRDKRQKNVEYVVTER